MSDKTNNKQTPTTPSQSGSAEKKSLRTRAISSGFGLGTFGAKSAKQLPLKPPTTISTTQPVTPVQTQTTAVKQDSENITNTAVQMMSPKNAQFKSFSEFKLEDCHPRKQRHYLLQLNEQDKELIQHGIMSDPNEKMRKDLKKDVPKMRTRDLDLPFKRQNQNKLGKLSFLSKTKTSKSPEVIFDLLMLSIIDDKEEAAENFLNELPDSWLKKKRPFESNLCFLMAMAHRMEKLTLLILDRGFPQDVNSPIFTMKISQKYVKHIPFFIHSSLFPSYFHIAVSLGLELLVKFMIKLGANVNQSWHGLTPLHIAAYAHYSRNNLTIVNTLIEYGADPWLGVYLEQFYLLQKLKDAMTSHQPRQRKKENQTRLQKELKTANLSMPSNEKFALLVPLSALPQKQVPQYRNQQHQNKKQTSQQSLSTTLEQFKEWKKKKFILPIDFAICSGNKQATLSILSRMQAVKPRRPVPASFGVPQPPQQSLLNQTVIIQQPQKDEFGLLLQMDPEITILLLKSGLVDVLQRDMRQNTALHLAVRAQNIDLMTILLYFDDHEGHLINAKGENGWTALHEAVSRGNIEIFRVLLKKGANQELKNDYGDTPKELGSKLGIADMEDLWFATLKRAGSEALNTSTMMPGSAANELISNLDSKWLQLIHQTTAPEQRNRRQSSQTQDEFKTPTEEQVGSTGSLPLAFRNSPNTGEKRGNTLRLMPFSKIFSSGAGFLRKKTSEGESSGGTGNTGSSNNNNNQSK